ncbi:hypothetical protein MRX96_023718 [Rhipicephalus microplus]
MSSSSAVDKTHRRHRELAWTEKEGDRSAGAWSADQTRTCSRARQPRGLACQLGRTLRSLELLRTGRNHGRRKDAGGGGGGGGMVILLVLLVVGILAVVGVLFATGALGDAPSDEEEGGGDEETKKPKKTGK